MAKVDYIQTSFAAGELGASLKGRTDLDQYGSAVAMLENILVRPYGSVISAPGSEYIATASIGSTKVRLIPFVFNRSDAYAIEMGVGYFRFLTDGGVVTSNGTIFAVEHSYDEDELFDVQFTQKDDVIWMTHPDHRPRQLIRMNASYWTFSVIDFVCSPFIDDNALDYMTLTVNNSTGTINVVAASVGVFAPSTGTSLGHWNAFLKIGGVRTDSTTGADVQGYVQITDVINSYTLTCSVIQQLTVTGATTSWAKPAWSGESGFPGSVTFFESRLWFARTALEPQKIWGSKPFFFDDFSVNSAADDDALNIQVASNEANEIQWLIAGRTLIAGTFGGDFIVSGGASQGVTPTNVTVKQQTSWGSEKLIPRRVGNYFYYIQRFGRKMRELFYFWDMDNYKSIDRTILSPEILGDGVVDMAYQQSPDTMVHCVLTDGTIATMTREIDQEVTAWSRQTTTGTYCSICVIPSATELHDQVWTVVQRTITPTTGTAVTQRYIELAKDIVVPDRQDMGWYLHSALRYNAYDQTAGIDMSLSATTGTVTVTTSAAHFNADDVGQRIRAIDANGVTLGEIKVNSYGTSTLVEGTVRSDFSALAYDGGLWGVSVTSITGLSHLEALEVGVLADGGVDKPAKTVSMGAITLAYDYFVVLAGLPYTQLLETLPPEAGSQRGTSQGKIQKISQVAFKVNRSFKGFKTGGTQALAEQINWRDPNTPMGSPETLYTGTIPNVVFRGGYNYGAKVVVVNDEPLPIEILSIIQTIDTNDK